jgi:hypothetical protein
MSWTGFDSRRSQRHLCFPVISARIWGPPSILGVKRPGLEAVHSTASGAEVKDVGAILLSDVFMVCN